MAILNYATGFRDIDTKSQALLSDNVADTYITGSLSGEYCREWFGATQTYYDGVLQQPEYNIHVPSGLFDIWVSFNYVGIGVTQSDDLLNFVDANGLAFLTFAANSGEDMIIKANDNVNGVETHFIIDGRWDIASRVDVHVNITEGVLRVYFDRSAIANEIVLDLSHVSSFSHVNYISTTVSSQSVKIHGMFLADEDTRGIVMNQHTITSKGALDNFSGDISNVTEVGKRPTGATMSVGGVDSEQTFAVNARNSGLLTGDIYAVGVRTNFAAPLSSDINASANLIYDGVNKVYGDDVTAETVPNMAKTIFTTAPDGSAWDDAKLAACEFGVIARAVV